MGETVLSTFDQGVRTITLNRPHRLNAMNAELVSRLADRFAEANADPATHAIIFTGTGRAFCAGDDLKERRHPATAEEARRSIEEIQRVTREIVHGDKFVVGAINGWAVGGGFEWAINCDLPIWAEGAKGFFPEMYWGAFVTGGVTAILPRIVGLTHAKEMILLGDNYSARQLLEVGVAWRVVADDKLLEEARAVAAKIAALPQRSVTDLKRVLNKAAYDDVNAAQVLETEATVRAFLDPETIERIAKFNE